MPELLIELQTAEIPARLQKKGAEQFLKLLQTAFNDAKLSYISSRFYVSPRHMAVVFKDLDDQVPDRHVERKGPRIDAPDQAIQGFLKSVDLTHDQCEQRETAKGTFLFAQLTIKGQPVVEILPAVISQAVWDIAWPTSMRWGRGLKSWIRPIHSGICLFGGQTVAFNMPLHPDNAELSIAFGHTTVGHRFMHPQTITVTDYEDYETKLIEAYVFIDHNKREFIIEHQLYEIAFKQNLQLVEDQELVDEVTGLVEWPISLLGKIQPAYMSLPPAVLKMTMRVHQRYFSLMDDEENLAPYFVTVSNIMAIDDGVQIIQGNERVLNARLADAKFFLDLDLKTSLPHMAKQLSKITFHAALGTMADKSVRLIGLVGYLANSAKADRITAQEAAALLKADLVSKMVGELPELQGIMGQYYAHTQGYSSEISQAIAEHYLPKLINDPLPASQLGQICAIADRIDTLVGFFAINVLPTSSKDPFALRRAAIGLLRLLEHEHAFNLNQCFAHAYNLYKTIFKQTGNISVLPEVLASLMKFIQDRLKVLWRDQGLRHDIIDACIAGGIDIPIYLLRVRVTILQNFLQDKNMSGAEFMSAYCRASNILRIEENKAGQHFSPDPDRNLLLIEDEIILVKFLDDNCASIQQAKRNHDIEKLIKILSSGHPHIDNYFNNVTVNCDELNIRHNRLKTLALLRQAYHEIADFSQIVDA